MTREQFLTYLEEMNERAAPYPVLINCHWCGKPIEDEFVLHWQSGKPHELYHPLCYEDPECW